MGANYSAYAGGREAFLTVIESSGGSTIQYSTYVGGSGNEEANGIVIDAYGFGCLAGFYFHRFPGSGGAVLQEGRAAAI